MGSPLDIIDNTEDETSYPTLPDSLVGLTERERRFAEAYFELSLQHGDQGSGILAYRRAFPLAIVDNRTAYGQSRQLLQQPRVVALVSWLRMQLASRRIVPAERVVDEIERIALANIMDYVVCDEDGHYSLDVSRFNSRTAAAVAEVTIDEKCNSDGEVTHRKMRIKLHNKLAALRMLVQIHKLNTTLSVEDLDRMIRDLEKNVGHALPALDHAAE